MVIDFKCNKHSAKRIISNNNLKEYLSFHLSMGNIWLLWDNVIIIFHWITSCFPLHIKTQHSQKYTYVTWYGYESSTFFLHMWVISNHLVSKLQEYHKFTELWSVLWIYEGGCRPHTFVLISHIKNQLNFRHTHTHDMWESYDSYSAQQPRFGSSSKGYQQFLMGINIFDFRGGGSGPRFQKPQNWHFGTFYNNSPGHL